MEMLDKNGDGRITKDERRGAFAAELLDRADREGKGYVTEEDLVIAIRGGVAGRPR
jgi:hypothetical protein